jgi:hypothetical protein
MGVMKLSESQLNQDPVLKDLNLCNDDWVRACDIDKLKDHLVENGILRP